MPDLTMTRGARHAAVGLLLLTLLVGGGNLWASYLEAGKVQRASASVVQLCQAGNTSRAQQVNLWDHIVAISKPPAGETRAAERRRLAATRAFLAYVHKVFTPRNCAARFH